MENLTGTEQMDLCVILRIRFDNETVEDDERQSIISIAIKVGLPSFFTNEMLSDLKV